MSAASFSLCVYCVTFFDWLAFSLYLSLHATVVNGHAREYIAPVELSGGHDNDKWQQVVLSLCDFEPVKTAFGPLLDWLSVVVMWLLPPVDALAFDDDKIVWTDFEWLPAGSHEVASL